MTKNVEFYCVDISELGNFSNFCMVTELAESSVNIAVSTYWLTYLASATRTQAIANLKRLLRPDGYLYLLDLVWTDANAIIYKLNQEEHWKSLIMTEMADSTFKVRCQENLSPCEICSLGAPLMVITLFKWSLITGATGKCHCSHLRSSNEPLECNYSQLTFFYDLYLATTTGL